MTNFNIESLGANKKKFQTAKMKVPAILHLSDELLPNNDTLAEIENVAASGYAFDHVAVMSDVHSKKGRKNPTGTAVASENHLLPQINDTAPNCGMRFIKTNLTDADVTPEKIDQLFKALIPVIPTKRYIGTYLPYQMIMDICRQGIAPLKKYLGTRIENEVENTFKGGNFFDAEVSEKEILDAIPSLFLRIGQYRLGILGAAGNHFLDLMKVGEVKNSDVAQKFGLHAGQYIFLLHTGSGLLGQYASYLYTPKRKEHFSQKVVLILGKLLFRSAYTKEMSELYGKIETFKDSPEFFAYDDRTIEGQLFMRAHNAAANQGFANRLILTQHLDQTLEKVFGRQIKLELLYDMPHVFVNREHHNGRDVWVHRNGSSRANGPARMSKHPLFSQTGEPAFIPSSMSTPAYLAVGTNENESTFFSASHGTGKRKNPEADAAPDKDALLAKMEKRHVKLYNAQSKGVIQQDAGYYKDVDEVVRGMEDNKIIKVVVKMEPIAVLMY